MKRTFDLVLLLPFLVFGTGVYLYVETQNEAHVQFLRAQEQWRNGNYNESTGLYRQVYTDYPRSRYADDALWEISSIHYVNFYDVNRTIFYLQKIISEYPESPRVRECKLRLAEIHEVELGDIPGAIEYWKEALSEESSIRRRNGILFRMANACFKINRFDEALEHFKRVLDSEPGEHLREQSQVRVGTILQIRKQYPESVRYFQQAAAETECRDCRIQAQLGMIESYEFMDEMERAIQIAQAIDPEDYPAPMKDELLARLNEKTKYYGLKVWNGR